MSYVVREVFVTLQGEGRWAGRRAVFVRLVGCNLWNGIPADRDKGKGACSQWCDTDFAAGDRMSLAELCDAADKAWGSHPYGRNRHDSKMIVLTGGEPTLQIDMDLVKELHDRAWFVAVETNGTRDALVLRHCDHVCVSPKKGAVLSVRKAHEIKVVLPGAVQSADGWKDDELRAIDAGGEWLEKYVQPQDVIDPEFVERTHLHSIKLGSALGSADEEQRFQANVESCLRFIRDNPGWRLSWQTHKSLGLR